METSACFTCEGGALTYLNINLLPRHIKTDFELDFAHKGIHCLHYVLVNIFTLLAGMALGHPKGEPEELPLELGLG